MAEMTHDPLAWLLGGPGPAAAGHAPAEESKTAAASPEAGSATAEPAAPAAGTQTPAEAAPVAVENGAASDGSAQSADAADPAQSADAERTVTMADGPLAFEEQLNVAAAAELKERLTSLLGREEVLLDAGAVERVDGASLQLLAAFCTEVERRGGRVHWSAISDPLREAARLTGLGAALRLG